MFLIANLPCDLVAVEEVDGAVGLGGLCFVVSHHDYGPAVFFVEVVEYAHDFGTHLGVEVAAGFVGEDNGRIAYDGTGYGHTLGLAARKLRGEVVHAVREAYFLECLTGEGFLVALETAAVEQGHYHVVEHIEGGYEVEALEDETEGLVAEAGKLFVAHAFGAAAVEFDGARCRVVEEADYVEKRGLSAARWAHDREKFAFGDFEVNVFERLSLDCLCAVNFIDIAKLYHIKLEIRSC